MLEDRLAAIAKEVREEWNPELLAEIDHAVASLAASGQAKRAVHAGQPAPRFRLPDQHGVQQTLDKLTASGPLVLSFYRGAWCPFCVADLESLSSAAETFAALGAQVAVISPEVASPLVAGLPFPALFDHGGRVANRYGLEWVLPAPLCAAMLAADVTFLNKRSDGSWRLPIPARYVIDRNGDVTFAEVNPDYRQRPEPLELLPVIEAIRERERHAWS